MTDQPAPNTNTVLDRHVESVILSGSPFVSSILGPGAYRIAALAAPNFFRDPIISGFLVPPSILTCEAESFTSSPRAVITYQWKRDAGDISGETSQTYTTLVSDIGTAITCEVTITNGSGSDTELSNSLTIVAIVPSSVYEHDTYVINGLSALARMDMNELDITIIAGMTHDDKVDLNQCEFHIITGMQGFNNMTISESESYPLFVPTFLSVLTVVNGDAEDSDMSDWIMESGGVTSVTTAPGFGADITTYREGLRFFNPNDLGQGVDSEMSQKIAIDVGDETDVDTGRCYAAASWIHQSEEGKDWIEVTLEAMNAASSVIATATTISPLNKLGGFQVTMGWMRDSSVNEILNLPTLTRFVNIKVLFKSSGSGSAGNNGYADDFKIDLLKVE